MSGLSGVISVTIKPPLSSPVCHHLTNIIFSPFFHLLFPSPDLPSYSHLFLSIATISLFLFINLSLPLVLCQFFPHPPSIFFFTLNSRQSCLSASVRLCRSCRCFFLLFHVVVFSRAPISVLISLRLYILPNSFFFSLFGLFFPLCYTITPVSCSLSSSLHAQPTAVYLCSVSSQSPFLFCLCSKAL